MRWPGPLGGDRAAEELAREADGEVADVDHLLHLAEALLGDLAGLERDERAERLLLAAQLLAQQPHELAAARRRDVAPGLEGRRGARDRGVGAGGVGAAQTRRAARRRSGCAPRDRRSPKSARSRPSAVEDVVDGEHGETSVGAPAGPDGRDRATTALRYAGPSADVAQLARASPCHGEGRGFEPLHPLPRCVRPRPRGARAEPAPDEQADAAGRDRRHVGEHAVEQDRRDDLGLVAAERHERAREAELDDAESARRERDRRDDADQRPGREGLGEAHLGARDADRAQRHEEHEEDGQVPGQRGCGEREPAPPERDRRPRGGSRRAARPSRSRAGGAGAVRRGSRRARRARRRGGRCRRR